MKRLTIAVSVTLMSLLAWGSACADFQGFTADGDLTEWGVTIDPAPNPGDAAFVPESGSIGIGHVWYAIEDADAYYVGPGYGGQNHDWEAIYVTYDDANIYVAVVTGFDQAGQRGMTDYVHIAGDVFFDFGSDGIWDVAVETGYAGTEGAVYTGTGEWWRNANYWTSSGVAEINYGADVMYLGDAEFIYTNPVTEDDDALSQDPYVDGDHNVIELSFSRYIGGEDLLAGFETFTVHWTIRSGNDVGEVTAPAHTPEPGTYIMIGSVLAGLFGAAQLKRRKRK